MDECKWRISIWHNKWLINHEGPIAILIKGTESREEKGFNANFTPQDFWFSQKDNHIYVTSLKWPENKDVLIKSMTLLTKDEINKIETVQLLGCDEKFPGQWQKKDFQQPCQQQGQIPTDMF